MEFIKSAIGVFLAVCVLYVAPLLFRIAVPLYGCHELMTFAVWRVSIIVAAFRSVTALSFCRVFISRRLYGGFCNLILWYFCLSVEQTSMHEKVVG